MRIKILVPVILGCLFCFVLFRLLVDNKTINWIHVVGHSGDFQCPTVYSFDDLKNDSNAIYFIDTLLKNKALLNEINRKIKKMHKDSQQSGIDPRLCAIVYYSNGDSILICLGRLGGTTFNGIKMVDDPDLHFLIKLNAGYYKGFLIKELAYFMELRDPAHLNEAKKVAHKSWKSRRDSCDRNDTLYQIRRL